MAETIFVANLSVTVTGRRRRCLRSPGLWLFRCFLPALFRFSLPLAVTRKRFLELLWVFNFGISRFRFYFGKKAIIETSRHVSAPRSAFWRDQGRHLFAFHARRAFNLAEISELFQHLLQDPPAFVDVLQVAVAELHLEEDLVVVFQELPRLADFRIEIVVAGVRTDANFLAFLLVLLSGRLLLRLLIAEFA